MKFNILHFVAIIALVQAAKRPLEEGSEHNDKRPRLDLKRGLSDHAGVPAAKSLKYEREKRGRSNSSEEEAIKRPRLEHEESTLIIAKRNRSDSSGQAPLGIKKYKVGSIPEQNPLVRPRRGSSFDTEEGPNKRLRRTSSQMEIDY